MQKMQAWITAFPEIDAVWADGGPCGVGVINVLEKNNMKMIPVSGEASGYVEFRTCKALPFFLRRGQPFGTPVPITVA